MKLLLSFFLLSAVVMGCAKTKEQIQEDLVIKAMTDGQWRITRFTQAGADITTRFEPYRFQFRSNNTVEVLNNGSLEKTGSWNADPSAKTISSLFSNASANLMLLNGTWQITKNSWTFVEATQTVNAEVLTLRLDK